MALDALLIGERLREIREKGFKESRPNFAKRCGLSERYIGQIERGEFVPSIQKLDVIVTALNIELDYLLYGKNKESISNIKSQLHTIINKCDDEQARVILNCISTIQNYYFKNQNKNDRNKHK